jgi:hypothetical protein
MRGEARWTCGVRRKVEPALYLKACAAWPALALVVWNQVALDEAASGGAIGC